MSHRTAERVLVSSLLIAFVVCASSCICWGQADLPIDFPDGIDDLVTPQDQLPPAIYMLDREDGSRIFIPKIPYQEFEESRNQGSAYAGNSRLPYTIESVEISGDASEIRAELLVTIRVELDESVDEAIDIPLRMNNFHRLEAFHVEGLEDYRASFDSKLGHVLTGMPKSGSTSVRIKARFAVRVSSGASQRIQFRLPIARTSVNVSVGGANLEAAVSGSPNDEPVQVLKTAGKAKCFLLVDATGGDFLLNWTKSGEESETVIEPLDVRGVCQIDWSDPQSVVIKAEYEFSGLSDETQTLQLAAPSNYLLLDDSLTSSAVTLISTDDVTSLYQASLDRDSQSGVPSLSLQFQLANASSSSETPLDFRGITFAGQVRETGNVYFRTAKGFRLRWLNGEHIRPAISTSTGADVDGRKYSFRYERGGFRIPVWLSAESNLVVARTNYEASLGIDSVQLDIIVEVSGTGEIGQSLQLNYQPWLLESINGQVITDLDSGAIDVDATRIRIEIDELLKQRDSDVTGRKLVAIRLKRSVSNSQATYALDLPPVRMPASSENVLLSPGGLRVSSALGTQVNFDPLASKGLQFVGESQADNSQEFQLLSTDPPITFSHSVTRRTPETKTEIRTVLNLGNELGDQVSQVVRVEFAYGSLSSLRFTALGEKHDWDAFIDSRPVRVERTGDGAVVAHFDPLPPGIYELNLAQPIEMPETNNAGQSILEVPVCLPQRTGAGRYQFLCEINSESMVFSDGKLSRLLNVTDATAPSVNLSLVNDQIGSLVVERMWIQSLLTSKQQRVRMVANVNGTSDAFVFDLVGWENNPEIRVLVDGRESSISELDGGGFSVQLPDDKPNHSVQIWAWSAILKPLGVLTRLEPAFVAKHRTGEIFWQLAVPSRHHLVFSASGARQTMDLKWKDSWLIQREPKLTTSQLESLFETVAGDDTLDNSNVYLFSSNDVSDFHVNVASRSSIWLVVASMTLAVSSLLAYFRPLRSPLFLLIIGFAVSGISVLLPDFAFIFGQVGLLSLGLTGILVATRMAISGWPRSSVFSAQRPHDGSTRSIPASNIVVSTEAVAAAAPNPVEVQ